MKLVTIQITIKNKKLWEKRDLEYESNYQEENHEFFSEDKNIFHKEFKNVNDINLIIDLTLFEVANGCSKNVKYEKKNHL